MRTKTGLLFVVIAGFFLTGFACAEENAVYDCREDVVYAIDHGIGLILDVFVPKGKTNGLGIIHIMHGGGYSHNEMREHFRNDYKIYDNFCSHGYTVFSVRPGSRTKFTIEEMTANLKTAIRWVKEHAVEYKVDPDRLGLTGASAGGHLALLSMVYEEAAEPNEKDPLKRHGTRICAAGLFFPPTDWLDADGKLSPVRSQWIKEHEFSGGCEDHSEEEILAKAEALSPVRQVKAVLPPVIIYHGDQDRIPIGNSEKIVDVIVKAGGRAELITMKGYGHYWPGIGKEVDQMADWFDKQLVRK